MYLHSPAMLKDQLGEAARTFVDVLWDLEGLGEGVDAKTTKKHRMLTRTAMSDRTLFALAIKGPRSFSLHVAKMGAVPLYKRCPLYSLFCGRVSGNALPSYHKSCVGKGSTDSSNTQSSKRTILFFSSPSNGKEPG